MISGLFSILTGIAERSKKLVILFLKLCQLLSFCPNGQNDHLPYAHNFVFTLYVSLQRQARPFWGRPQNGLLNTSFDHFVQTDKMVT
jgi:hypothetical protein